MGMSGLGWINSAIKYLAPLAGLVAFLSGWISEIVKANVADPRNSAQLRVFLGRAALIMAGIILPLLLWQMYVALCNWAIPRWDGSYPAPTWLRNFGPLIWIGYLLTGVVASILSWPLQPNANSLHRLYRDRLGDAFLFDMGTQTEFDKHEFASPRKMQHREGTGRSVDRMRLSSINPKTTPYLLVNSALNIEGSSYVNKRARNADFFVFSRDYIGSRATGYVPTKEMEKALQTLDLATVIAISGAAASSNMGSRSKRILAPTLALLNIRLGYWMPNPGLMQNVIGRRGAPVEQGTGKRSDNERLRDKVLNNLYLFAEMFSLLDESSQKVYLTDGGYVENLGIYELLKRRCRVIVAIDAEADPALYFTSFVTLQRYARIDLGVRIELPWREIRQRYLACAKELSFAADSGVPASSICGSHAAVGIIDYPDAPNGWLIYIKSSLTGDEGDLILDYKRRNWAFPHETTGDQFFGEEQFEAYRALGFHATIGVFSGRDYVSGLLPTGGQDEPQPSEKITPQLSRSRMDRLNEIFET
jgi:hypothetical protein